MESLENSFHQKKVNHIFHYLNNFENLLKIIKEGFAPSYCKEVINEVEYYIPMVSFCNIPLRDVDLYMRYGKYGIGMSLEWALRNSISPVIYIHENTPFKELHTNLLKASFFNLTRVKIPNLLKAKAENRDDNTDYDLYYRNIDEIMNISIPTLQFFKNWKTTYKGQELTTYQEREWRFVPELEQGTRILTKNQPGYESFMKNLGSKPHLRNLSLSIDFIQDLRYVITKDEKQSERVRKTLIGKFGDKNVYNAVVSGKLMIMNDETIFHDF